MTLGNVLKIVGLAIPLTLALTNHVNAENSGRDAVHTTPILQPNIDKAIQHIDTRATELLNITGVPGMAIAVVQGDRVLYTRGFGVRKLGSDLKVTPETVFQLASMSKSISATVVAASVSQGTVQWNDPVAKYLDGFSLANPEVGAKVTIAEMYAHRSGLPEYAGDDLEDLGYKRMDIINRLKYLPLSPFLVSYHYTNYGMTAAGQAVALANKLPWEDLSKKMLYEPLEMTSTSSKWADYNKASNKADLHIKNNDRKWVTSARQPDEQSPAAAVSSNVNDMAKWMILQLGEGTYMGQQVIKKDALLAMRRLPDSVRPLVPEAGNYYGLGMKVRTDKTNRMRFYHEGHFSSGGSTTYELLPSAKLGIVVLSNGLALNPHGGIVVGVPETIAQEFYDIVEFGHLPFDRYNEIVATMSAEIPKSTRSAAMNKTLSAQPVVSVDQIAGTYSNDYFGSITIDTIDGAPQFTIGPDENTFVLHHSSAADAFVFTAPGGSLTDANSLKFKLAADGKPAKIIIDIFNKNGLGTFNKVTARQ